MSKIGMTMDRLPVDILEIIFDKFLWENPGELYRLRAVSRTWKSIAERSASRVFKYWYNRCKKDIPEDHLQDIVQAKYPLVAHPWQEFYWVDRGLPYVAKNVYQIWKNFSDFNDEIDNTKLNYNVVHDGNPWDPIIGMNDKYFAISYHSYDDEEDDNRVGTRIYRWDSDNLHQHIWKDDFISNQIDFYCTEKGTFIVLGEHQQTDDDDDFEIYISKYPIESLDRPFELTLLGRSKKYCITQNECFYITGDDSADSFVVEHKILTERGFETSTIIQPPPEMSQYKYAQFRVEISGCTLYVIKGEFGKISVSKYKISRNAAGKLSFTLGECKILDRNDQRNDSALYYKIDFLFESDVCTNNIPLTDFAFATEKFHPWLFGVSHGKMDALAIHANNVFCAERGDGLPIRVCILQKHDLTERMEANDPDNLKRNLIFNMQKDFSPDWEPTPRWISIIYIGLKARILAHYDSALCLIKFY